MTSTSHELSSVKAWTLPLKKDSAQAEIFNDTAAPEELGEYKGSFSGAVPAPDLPFFQLQRVLHSPESFAPFGLRK